MASLGADMDTTAVTKYGIDAGLSLLNTIINPFLPKPKGGAPPPSSGLPGWAIPAGIGAVGLVVILMAAKKK